MATPAPSFLFVATGLTEAQQLRAARASLGWTQWQVAQAASVAPWAVSALERDARYVPPSWKARIRATLGLEATDAS